MRHFDGLVAEIDLVNVVIPNLVVKFIHTVYTLVQWRGLSVYLSKISVSFAFLVVSSPFEC